MDPITVTTPDGQRFQFPAGTDQLTMKRAIDEHYRTSGGAAPAAAPAPKPSRWDLRNTASDYGFGPSAIPGADWLRTRATNAAASAAEFGEMVNPLGPARFIARQFAPETVGAVGGGNIIRNAFDKSGVPRVNAEGEGGKILDAATEAAIGSVVFPGNVLRNVVPAAVGGAASEFAGQQAEGKWYEIPARILAGVAGGGAAAAGQAGLIAGARGVRNALGAGNVEDKAAGIVGRAIARDKLTPKQLLDQTKALGDDAMPVDAGGENVRGALRGSIAAPGEARTTVRNAFIERAEKEGSRVGASIDRNVSPKSLTTTVDELIVQRNTVPKPLYEKALDVGQVWSPRVQQFLDDPLVQPGIRRGLEIQRLEALAQNKPFDPKAYGVTGFNAAGDPIITGTPNMRLLDAAKKGIDAIIDDFRDPTTGRVILNERGRAIESVRKAYLAELDNLNPDYAAARAAYATPSQMKDAAELGMRLFSGNARPDVVKREFARLPPDAQDAFRVGVAEHLRKIAGARDSTNVAGRVMGGPDAQARLTAVLGKDEAGRIMDDLAREKTFTRSMREVTQGSRTAPMALEGADNAQAAGGAASALARGEPVNALMRAAGAVAGRVGEGRTEAVNAQVAKILTSIKPEDRTAFANALEQAILRQRLNSPRNAFRAGTGAPLPGAASPQRRE
jgi:hypothetical protein